MNKIFLFRCIQPIQAPHRRHHRSTHVLHLIHNGMELKDFSKQLKSHSKQIDHLMRRRLPVIAGRMAKDFFQNSFRISAFVNGGVHHWQTTQRQPAGGKAAASRYGPLLSSRNHLFASIKYTPSDYRVKVANDLLYAPIHNWGGTLHLLSRLRCDASHGPCSIARQASSAMPPRRAQRSVPTRLLPIHAHRSGVPSLSQKRRNSPYISHSDSSSEIAESCRT